MMETPGELIRGGDSSVILKVENLHFRWGANEVLKNINFDVSGNEMVAILGKNGAGKTTLIKCLNRINQVNEGKVTIASKDVSKMPLLDLSKSISYVPQTVRTSFPMEVFDVLMLGRRPHVSWRTSPLDRDLVSQTLRQFGLEELAFRRFDRLSGGERQRVVIAKAVVQDPSIYLLDEPTSDLDLWTQLLTMETIRDIINDSGSGKSAIFAIHDINIAARYSDRVMLLHEGEILADGPPEDVITRSNIAKVFGVECDITQATNDHSMNVVIGKPITKRM